MSQNTEVLYNAECPVCSREVDHYARLSERGALPITYDDLGDTETLKRWGLSAEDAAKRLHVRKDGQLYAGLPAFIVLWQEIPQTRWLARVFALPGVNWIGAKTYDHLLAPLLYWMHQRRMRRQVT